MSDRPVCRMKFLHTVYNFSGNAIMGLHQASNSQYETTTSLYSSHRLKQPIKHDFLSQQSLSKLDISSKPSSEKQITKWSMFPRSSNEDTDNRINYCTILTKQNIKLIFQVKTIKYMLFVTKISGLYFDALLIKANVKNFDLEIYSILFV